MKITETKHFKERFEYIFTYNDIDIYDINHAIDRFLERHKDLNFNDVLITIRRGLSRIDFDYNNTAENYMIISRSTNLKIPLELTYHKQTDELIAVIPTVLDKSIHKHNTRDDIEILTEKSKREHSFNRIYEINKNLSTFPFCHYFEDGEYSKSFEVINVK